MSHRLSLIGRSEDIHVLGNDGTKTVLSQNLDAYRTIISHCVDLLVRRERRIRHDFDPSLVHRWHGMLFQFQNRSVLMRLTQFPSNNSEGTLDPDATFRFELLTKDKQFLASIRFIDPDMVNELRRRSI